MSAYQVQTQPNYAALDDFLKKYVSATGEVDYTKIKANIKELDLIVKELSSTIVAGTWNKHEKLAFWINTYNVFTIQLLVQNFPIQSIQNLDGGKTWDVKRIHIGGKKYSLNNIENDIIRPQFKDARIHFAVNCGAKSCPPLLNAAYIPSKLEAQLENQTKKFFNSKKYQKITPNAVSLTKIMDWYAIDFGNILDFVNKYSDVKVNKDSPITFQNYDWSLNGK